MPAPPGFLGVPRFRPGEPEPGPPIRGLHPELQRSVNGGTALEYHSTVFACDELVATPVIVGVLLGAQAIAVDPRQVDALRWLAMEAAAVGDLLTQYQMMIRVFETAPLDPFYLPDLERVLVKNLGDPLRMATLMERALALDPANTEAQAQLKKALALLAAPDGTPRRSPRLEALPAHRGETK